MRSTRQPLLRSVPGVPSDNDARLRAFPPAVRRRISRLNRLFAPAFRVKLVDAQQAWHVQLDAQAGVGR
jgi:hypothetical protein